MARPCGTYGGEKRILGRKPDGKRPLRRPRGRWDILKLILNK
jgi:hypothetical protein